MHIPATARFSARFSPLGGTLVRVGALALGLAAAGAHGQSVEKLWTKNCSHCHGADGQGGGAGTPSLLTDELFQPKYDRPFFDLITKGKPETPMAAFGEALNEEEIWALVVHIREMQAEALNNQKGNPEPDAKGVYATMHTDFRFEPVIEKGLQVPWSVDFLPSADPAKAVMLVTERPGKVRVVRDGVMSKEIAGTPGVRNNGQGGMMDVAVHPEFAKNGWVYLAFSDKGGEGGNMGFTKIVRGKISPAPSEMSAEAIKDAEFSWKDQETIFEAKQDHYSGGGIHFGCRIIFQKAQPAGEKGEEKGGWYVYFGIGERGIGERAQDVTRPNGKIYRVWDDGKAPSDNPFVKTENAYPQIWSYGHRNPQGLCFDTLGNLWDTEHGPRGGDEFNKIEKGRNYGWPLVCFSINYNDTPLKTPWAKGELADGDPSGEPNDIMMPKDRWLPSIGACGLDCLRVGSQFEAWQGDFFAGGLSGSNVDRLRVKDGVVVEHENLLRGIGRVRDVVCGPDGNIYIVLNGPDKVMKIVPKGK